MGRTGGLQRGDMVSVSPTQSIESPVGHQKGWSDMKLDVSSEDAARHSLLRYVGLEEVASTEDGHHNHNALGWGTVITVDEENATALISLWKRGTTLYAGADGRPKEAFPLSQLTRVTAVVFNRQCRKSFMAENCQYLKLRGEGHDESVPLSLVAYNNKIINQLLEKTDTKTPFKRAPRQRGRVLLGGHRAKLEAFKQYNPMSRDPSDPLGEVRDQLKELASVGRAKNGKGRMSARQRTAQRTLMSGVEVEVKDAAEGDTAAGLGIDGTAPTAHHPSAMGRHLSTQQSTLLHSLNRSFVHRKRNLISSLNETTLLKGWHEGTISEVTPGLIFIVRTEGKLVSVKLAKVAVNCGRAFLEVKMCEGEECRFEVVGVDVDGVAMVRMFVGGTDVQLRLVKLGMAQVNTEELEKEDDTELEELRTARSTAFHSRLGIWGDDRPDPTEPADPNNGIDHNTGSLFDTFFSSPEYLALTKSNPSLLAH